MSIWEEDKFLVMARKGGAGLWPENTVYAFEKAVELGADVLELDTRTTKDGHLVVIHDKTVNRTTDGNGAVKRKTLEGLKKLDAGYWWTNDDGKTYPHRGKGIKIPLLKEVFEKFSDVPMHIELKRANKKSVGYLCRELERHNRLENTTVTSFSSGVAKNIRQLCPGARTATTRAEKWWFYILYLCGLGRLYKVRVHALEVAARKNGLWFLNKRFVQSAQRLGLRVYVWGADSGEGIKRVLATGADGVFTNRPERWLSALGRSKNR